MNLEDGITLWYGDRKEKKGSGAHVAHLRQLRASHKVTIVRPTLLHGHACIHMHIPDSFVPFWPINVHHSVCGPQLLCISYSITT